MAMSPTILTADGLYFDFLDPTSESITLEAVARGLSNICRFNGQCHRFYSVAEHSVLVSRRVPEQDARAALMHDAAEAFIGDVTKPLKRLLPDYQAIEQRVEAAVFARFGIPLPLPESVKRADREMLYVEQRQAMLNADGWSWATETDDVPDLAFLSPTDAYAAFMARARELAIGETQ